MGRDGDELLCGTLYPFTPSFCTLLCTQKLAVKEPQKRFFPSPSVQGLTPSSVNVASKQRGTELTVAFAVSYSCLYFGGLSGPVYFYR